MIFKLAWRNIWRNKLRSIVVVAAIAVGLAGGNFGIAFIYDFANQLINRSFDLENTHLSIYAQPLPEQDHNKLISKADSITKILNSLPGVHHASGRIKTEAVIASAQSSTNVMLTGINLDEEQNMNILSSLITQGSYLGTGMNNPILIGQQLADDLGVSVGSRLIATLQDTDGELLSTVFFVGGIFIHQNSSFERRNAFAPFKTVGELIGAESSSASEIGIQLTHGTNGVNEMQALIQANHPDLLVKSWEELRPEIAFIYRYTNLFNTIIIIIILVALSLAVINIMMKMVMERNVEFGMLKAIGLKNRKLFAMIVTETFLLFVLGTAVGMMLSLIILHWTASSGIDLSAYLGNYSSPTRDYQSPFTAVIVVYPAFVFSEFIKVLLLVMITSLLASLLPARQALKSDITEAIKM